jgi:UDP-2-acetamido-3-amino-2,3-dideoxy-glucuronate N-acetyltransferase
MSWFRHPLSDIQSEHIGNGTRIWQYSVILKDAIIGENCNINCHTFIENDVIIGNNVTIKCGVYLWDGIRIEDDVFIGPNATFINNNYPRSQKYPIQHIGVYICKGATIGANATIFGGIKIGEYALIGAGSVVTKNIPNNSIWVGNPAIRMGNICDCGQKLNNELICSKCSLSYKIINKNIVRNDKVT